MTFSWVCNFVWWVMLMTQNWLIQARRTITNSSNTCYCREVMWYDVTGSSAPCSLSFVTHCIPWNAVQLYPENMIDWCTLSPTFYNHVNIAYDDSALLCWSFRNTDSKRLSERYWIAIAQHADKMYQATHQLSCGDTYTARNVILLTT